MKMSSGKGLQAGLEQPVAHAGKRREGLSAC
jgi:hypothetical protein